MCVDHLNPFLLLSLGHSLLYIVIYSHCPYNFARLSLLSFRLLRTVTGLFRYRQVVFLYTLFYISYLPSSVVSCLFTTKFMYKISTVPYFTGNRILKSNYRRLNEKRLFFPLSPPLSSFLMFTYVS